VGVCALATIADAEIADDLLELIADRRQVPPSLQLKRRVIRAPRCIDRPDRR
jgi:hypothetical protein